MNPRLLNPVKLRALPKSRPADLAHNKEFTKRHASVSVARCVWKRVEEGERGWKKGGWVFFFPNGCKSFTFYIHAMEDGEEGGGKSICCLIIFCLSCFFLPVNFGGLSFLAAGIPRGLHPSLVKVFCRLNLPDTTRCKTVNSKKEHGSLSIVQSKDWQVKVRLTG